MRGISLACHEGLTLRVGLQGSLTERAEAGFAERASILHGGAHFAGCGLRGMVFVGQARAVHDNLLHDDDDGRNLRSGFASADLAEARPRVHRVEDFSFLLALHHHLRSESGFSLHVIPPCGCLLRCITAKILLHNMRIL